MTTIDQQLQKELPQHALREVKLSDIDHELSQLDFGETLHLEQEFFAYQDHYPREN